MPSIHDNRTKQPFTFTKKAGSEPIPGYVLIEPLGHGGFGEVWKCEAPGGLHKAIKFVFGNSESSNSPSDEARQEYQAFQRVKAIRHPFLLTLERLDLIGSELLIVMELADRHLGDRFYECTAQGLSGIPRDELLGYLLEAAEGLDLIGAKHDLQHLDVKPGNLFVTGGHVQLGDFGLASKLAGGTYSRRSRGLTPEYAAPELHQGKIHGRTDQYSLALVYHELLTGTFPFSGSTPEQIAEQHLSTAPNLSRLSERDRSAIGRALSKQPDDRYPSCLAFIRAMTTVASSPPMNSPRLTLITPNKNQPTFSDQSTKEPIAKQRLAHEPIVKTDPNPRIALNVPLTAPLRNGNQERPRLITAVPLPPQPIVAIQPNVEETTPPPVSPSIDQSQGPFPFKLEQIRSVFPIAHLLGRECGEPNCNAEEFVYRVVLAAQTGESKITRLGRVNRLRDKSWSCRFLSNIDPRVAQVKLNLLIDETGATIGSTMKGRVVFRRPFSIPVKSVLFGTSSFQELDSGLEVVVQLPEPGRGTTEILTTGRLYGNPSEEFEDAARPAVVKLIEEIRDQLTNIEERRQYQRFPATFPVSLYPLHSDGRLEPSIQGRCKDVSESGLALYCRSKPATRYVYVAFESVLGIEGLAILVQIVRSEQRKDEELVCGRYRLDFTSDSPV
jgi:serine/threonine protein kinase